MQENAPSQFDRIIRDIALLQTKDEERILHTIHEVIKIKLSYMEGDEFDTGKRNLLNYGHEFGHALEPASSFAIPHGIAVLIGIIFANAVAVNRGWLDRKMFNFLNDNLLLVNIPRDVIKLEKEYFKPETLLKNMKNDKKKVSKDLPLVLPKENFTLHKITDLKKEEFHQGLADLETVLGI
jgi:3-dehydroquinate synthase